MVVLLSRSSLWQPYISTFLNKFLIFFDGFFPLFGTLSVGVMSGASPRHPTPILSSSLAWLLTTAPPPQCVHNVRVVCVCVCAGSRLVSAGGHFRPVPSHVRRQGKLQVRSPVPADQHPPNGDGVGICRGRVAIVALMLVLETRAQC